MHAKTPGEKKRLTSQAVSNLPADGIPQLPFVFGKLEEIIELSSEDGNESQGDEHEIRFCVRPDNVATSRIHRRAASASFPLLLPPPPFFPLPFADALLPLFLSSSLDSESLFIRVTLKNALYLSPSYTFPACRCSKLLLPMVILAHT